jgi:hypothetical protein
LAVLVGTALFLEMVILRLVLQPVPAKIRNAAAVQKPKAILFITNV